MAEGTSHVDITEEPAEVKEKGSENLECAVCLQPCIHPAQLPCGHIFCFLCVKGIANQSKRCAMCRQEIPRDFIEQPKLLQRPETAESFDGGYQWFYEGRNGWWQYDPRTSEDIEQAFQLHFEKFEILICGETYVIDFQEKVQYPKKSPTRKRCIKRDLIGNVNLKGVAGINKLCCNTAGSEMPEEFASFMIPALKQPKTVCVLYFKGCWWQYDERTSRELEACYKAGERTCELLIAGFLYVADLDGMIQMRRNDHSRRRRIKRDLACVPKKGVAGLRTETDHQLQTHIEFGNSSESQRPHSPTEGRTDSLIPVTPSNTPQTPASGRESPHHEDLEATVERIRSLRLDTSDSSVRLRVLHMENPDLDEAAVERIRPVHLNAPDSSGRRRGLLAEDPDDTDETRIAYSSHEEFRAANYSRFQF